MRAGSASAAVTVAGSETTGSLSSAAVTLATLTIRVPGGACTGAPTAEVADAAQTKTIANPKRRQGTATGRHPRGMERDEAVPWLQAPCPAVNPGESRCLRERISLLVLSAGHQLMVTWKNSTRTPAAATVPDAGV